MTSFVVTPPATASSMPLPLAEYGQHATRCHALTDAALIARIAAHDRVAFAELHQRYARRVFPLVLRATRSNAQARAILPRAFSGVWERAGGFKATDTPPFRWIASIVQEETLAWLRAHGQRTEADEEAWRLRGEDELLNALARSVPAGFETILARDERRVIELAFFAGLTRSEIARLLRVPRPEIETRLRHALLKLKARDHPRRGSVHAEEIGKSMQPVRRTPHFAVSVAQRSAA